MTKIDQHTLRGLIEHAMQQALATFPARPRARTCYLVGYLVAILDLDVEIANRFLGPTPYL